MLRAGALVFNPASALSISTSFLAFDNSNCNIKSSEACIAMSQIFPFYLHRALGPRMSPFQFHALWIQMQQPNISLNSCHALRRLAPTCEWDTAAADIIVQEAGGVVLQAGTCNNDGKALEDWRVSGTLLAMFVHQRLFFCLAVLFFKARSVPAHLSFNVGDCFF